VSYLKAGGRLHPFRLDQASGLRLRIFAFKVLVIIPISIAFAVNRKYPLFGTAALFCAWNSIFSGVAALFRRDRCNAASLTAWDETAAFLGLATLMHLLQIIIA
jgi:hypothetical protein